MIVNACVGKNGKCQRAWYYGKLKLCKACYRKEYRGPTYHAVCLRGDSHKRAKEIANWMDITIIAVVDRAIAEYYKSVTKK
jgi:hypothetical protein